MAANASRTAPSDRELGFAKYHGLGNDYIVIDGGDLQAPLSTHQIQQICHRNYGVGSDGILLDLSDPSAEHFTVRIFNPDGSEAEKSGNGLRIFSRYLWDQRRVGEEPFAIETAGGWVTSRVHPGARVVTVELGYVSFDSARIPVQGPPREVLDETMEIDGETLRYCAVTIGNPHCVVLCDEVSEAEARRLGPRVETEPRFPNRTNVQFMKVLDRNNIQIEIWERGAGYTLASGTSSSAAAAVAHRMGLCDAQIAVHVPGGVIDISIGKDYAITMTGAVTKVCDGHISREVFQ